MIVAELRNLLTFDLDSRGVYIGKYDGRVYAVIDVTAPPPLVRNDLEQILYANRGANEGSSDPSAYVDRDVPEHVEPLRRSARGIFRTAAIAIASMLRGGSSREMK